jgi:hypothetical protein
MEGEIKMLSSVFNRFYQINAIKATLAMFEGKVSKRTQAALDKAHLIVRLRCKCGATATLRKINGQHVCEHCVARLSDRAQQLLTLPRRERRKLGVC